MGNMSISGIDIKARRTALGISQAELAAAIGVARNTVSRWENGKIQVRHGKMVSLAIDYFQVVLMNTPKSFQRKRLE